MSTNTESAANTEPESPVDAALIIRLERLQQNERTTLGQMTVDGKSFWTLEDTLRKQKIKKLTAIPEGKYEIKLRTTGGIHQRYLTKFGKEFHKGTLHLQDVPNFQYILIHIGNDKEDTEGCILLGELYGKSPTGDYKVWSSTKAYQSFYPIVRDALVAGQKVFIEIKNNESLTYFD